MRLVLTSARLPERARSYARAFRLGDIFLLLAAAWGALVAYLDADRLAYFRCAAIAEVGAAVWPLVLWGAATRQPTFRAIIAAILVTIAMAVLWAKVVDLAPYPGDDRGQDTGRLISFGSAP